MYRLGITQRRKLSFSALGMALVGSAMMGALGLMAYRQVFVTAATPDPTVKVQPLWPANNAVVANQVTLRSTVSGVDPGAYEMFWAVDNGQWNRMQTDASNPAVATASIDVSSWNWKQDKQYDISFIALMKSNWQPVTSSVRMEIGDAPTANTGQAENKSQPVSGAVPAAPAAPVALPAANQSNLYTNVDSDVSRNAAAQAASDPANAGLWRKLAEQPIAEWYGGWSGSIQTATDKYVSAAATAGKMPVLVAYNIPDRDCGSHSAGGSDNAAAYISWIQGFAKGIGQRQAMVIVEPDALAQLDCLSGGARQQRTELLSQAVSILNNTTKAKIYIDAGHADWHSPATMAARLKSANIAQADGFSLNVSNFVSTSNSLEYGNDIAKLVNNKHFVIDTSRNGNGQDKGVWCNPAGRALGQAPTLRTNNALADAYLWIKLPGASDGGCGPAISGSSAPAAGVWWSQYALQLLRNSSW